jgi:hypothetical protein
MLKYERYTLLPSLSFQNKMQQFSASVIISEQLNGLMVNAAQELAQRAVFACAEHYKFDADEAIGLLGLNNVKLERKSAVKDEEVKEKVKGVKGRPKKEKNVIQIEGDDDDDDGINEMAMVLIQVLNAYPKI